MNRIMPLIILAVMALILYASWKNVLSYNADQQREYTQHIEAAEKYMEKDIVIDAVAEYKSALKLRPQYDTAMTIVKLYDELDMPAEYSEACQKAIEVDPTQKEPYILLTDFYLNSSKFRRAFEILHDAEQQFGDDEDIFSRIQIVKSKYTMTKPYSNVVKPLYTVKGEKSGYMVYEAEGLYGLLSSGNRVFIKAEYEDIGLLSEKLIPVKKHGEYYYVNENGYRKLVPDTPADYLGTFGDNYAPAAFNGRYGYVDNKLKEYAMEYDYTGCFADGIAAVKKGNKWAIINTSFEIVTDFVFDEIVLDDYDFCSTWGVFFAKQNGKYALYDKHGEKISEDFDEVRPFVSEEPAAVKKDEKWGLLSITGEIVLEPQYDDLKSMNLGYAPVQIDGLWGFIDQYGNQLIEPQFDSLESFTSKGYSMSELDGLRKFVVVHVYE